MTDATARRHCAGVAFVFNHAPEANYDGYEMSSMRKKFFSLQMQQLWREPMQWRWLSRVKR